jgi:hypothetical protein
MELDDLKDAWTTAGETAGDTSLEELTPRLQRLRRRIFWRDAREIVAVAFLFPIFAWVGWHNRGPLTARISIGVILASLLLIVGGLLWARRPRVPLGSSMDEHLRAELRYLDRQISILHHITWWYVAPLTIGVEFLVVAGRAIRPGVIAYVVVTLAFSAFVVRLNRRGARRLRSMRESLVRGLDVLHESEASH